MLPASTAPLAPASQRLRGAALYVQRSQLGSLASALTKNQIIAAILGFAFILLHFLIGVFVMQQAQDHQEFRPIMDYVAIKGHIESFASGLLDTRPMVYYTSGTLFILMLTHQVLEYRRWKS